MHFPLLSYFRGENEIGGFNKNALKGSFIRVDPIQARYLAKSRIIYAWRHKFSKL